MNNRSRPGGDDVRARLLDAAEALVTDHRPAAITSRDIARQAGLSVGVLYNHFADKHELLLAALVRRFDRATAAYGELPPPSGRSIEERLATVIGRALAIQVDLLPLLRNLVGDPALLQRFLVGIHTAPLGGIRFHEPVGRFLAEEGAAGALSDDLDADLAADLIVALALHDGLREVLGRHSETPAEQDARHRAIARLLLDGIGPARSSPP